MKRYVCASRRIFLKVDVVDILNKMTDSLVITKVRRRYDYQPEGDYEVVTVKLSGDTSVIKQVINDFKDQYGYEVGVEYFGGATIGDPSDHLSEMSYDFWSYN